MALAFSYVRFSSDRQQHGSSVARQLDAAQKYALAHDLTLDTSTYRDLGVSAFKSKNSESGALGAFIQAVDAGKVSKGSYLLVESLDRLSRDDVDIAMELFLNLTRKGITIVTLMDQQVYSKQSIKDNWTKLIMALAVMARANEESVVKSNRAKGSYADRRKKGEIAQNKYPSWLKKIDKRTFEVIPERAALVNRMFDMSLQGFGGRIIARTLHQEGIPVWQWAKEWNQSLVGNILKNPAVYGAVKNYPAIMSKEKFFTALAGVKARTWKGGRPNTVPNIFAGVSWCAFCGSRMRYVPSGDGFSSLRCRKSVDLHECKGKAFPYGPSEAAFIRRMTRYNDGVDISGEYIEEQMSEAPMLRAEIDTLKDKQKKLVRMAMLAEDVDAIADEMKVVQEQIKANEARLAKIDVSPLTKSEIKKHKDLFEVYWKLTAKKIDAADAVPWDGPDLENPLEGINLVDMRRKMRAAIARLFERLEFGVGKEGWEPTIFATLVDGRKIDIDVSDFLPPQSLRAQKKK